MITQAKFALPLLVAVGLTGFGCAGFQKIPVDPALWSQKQTRIAIAFAAPPPAQAHRVGAQGLLDAAINAGMASDLEKHLGGLQPAQFTPVLDQFEGRLKKEGFTVKRIPHPIDLEKLPKVADHPDGTFDRDVRAIAAYENVDAILLVGAESWGTLRNYYGFIPLGDPKGLFRASGRLIASDGRLRWQTAIEDDDAIVPISGEWDEAPRFPNATRAIESAERKAAVALEKSFFGSVAPRIAIAPRPAAPPAPAVAPAPSAPPPSSATPTPPPETTVSPTAGTPTSPSGAASPSPPVAAPKSDAEWM